MFLFPFLIEGRIIPNELVIQIHENLYGMTCCDKRIVFLIVDFVIEHNLCCFSRAIDDVDAWTDSISDRLLIVKTEFYDRSKIAMIEESHVFQPVFLAESHAGILELERVVAMPNYVHRIDFAETYIKLFGFIQFFHLSFFILFNGNFHFSRYVSLISPRNGCFC